MIDAFECGEHHGSLLLRDDWPSRPFQASSAVVAVECDDQAIAKRCSLLQILNVSGVQQVVAAVREHDLLAELLARINQPRQFVEVADLLVNLARAADQVAENLLPSDRDNADPFDFESSRDVREPTQILRREPVGHADTDHRQHHVTGTGDVVDLAFASREQFR